MGDVSRPDFRTRAQVILDEIRNRILGGVIPPGARLLLKPIAEEFKCSEIPVREAFRSLQSEGLINVVPHAGAFVSAPRIDELVQLTEIRAILEPEATVSAASYIDNATLAILKGMLSEMASLAERNASEEYGRLNRRFHNCILDKAPNQKLVSLVKDLWGQAERARLVYRKGPEFLSESVRQHTEIVDAIERHDIATLRRLVAAHGQFGLEAVRSLAAKTALGDMVTKEGQG